MTAEAAVAIVGMGLRLPGASTPAEFWRLVEAAEDASREVPPGRWPVAPAAVTGGPLGAPGRVPSARGYFVGEPAQSAAADPAATAHLDPLFRLVQAAGVAAFADCVHDRVDRRRAGIVLGNLALPTEHSSQAARAVLGATFAEHVTGLPACPPVVAPDDLAPCAQPAAYLARALGLGGGTFTLDAACASSLVALKLAADALRAGGADLMLAGGVSRPDAYYTQLGFAQLRALAADGRCRPLDARATGLVVGEGAAVFALKRLGDAVRANDRIYGVLRGFGLANDLGGGLLAPSVEGQLRAMRAAYAEAGWRPADVDLLEAHATGTPLGDGVELASVTQLWAGTAGAGACVIGSVKGNVGHLLTAAGGASLAKVLLALRAGQLPPTANYAEPAAALAAPGSPFRVLARAEPWAARRPGVPRRAAINGFGFGGINAHVLVEEWLGPAAAPARAAAAPGATRREVAVIGVASRLGGERSLGPLGALGWWGSERTAWWRARFPGPAPEVRRLSALRVPASAFRIPPVELAAMLPQQLLMLLVARAAAAPWRARPRACPAARTDAGVYIGLGLDGGASHFGAAWTLAAAAERWVAGARAETAAGNGPAPLPAAELQAWLRALQEAFGHELSANHVTGSLAGVIGSRIARELGFGGPALTVSNEEGSGLRALALAAAAIRRGELTMALVGAVDCAAQLLHVVATRLRAERDGVAPPAAIADGAVALLLKEHAQALADGDEILALVERSASVGAATPAARPRTAATPAGLAPGEPGATPVWVERAAAAALPYLGAAAGLWGVARAVGALRDRQAGGDYWLRNRDAGARRAVVECASADGTAWSVALREAEGNGAGELGPGHERFGLFVLTADREGLPAAAGRLLALAARLGDATPRALARAWRHAEPPLPDPAATRRWVLVTEAGRGARLDEQLRALAGEGDAGGDAAGRYAGAGPAAGTLALSFPGSGCHYQNMGRELVAAFPGVVARQDAAAADLRAQFGADRLWGEPDGAPLDQPTTLGAQCSLACLAVDVLALFAVRPEAAIGYSLGESAALLALRAWPDRQGLYRRLKASDLFTHQLAGEQLALRRHWQVPAGAAPAWANFLVRQAEAAVRAALAGLPRAYLTCVNTAAECVIGGDRAQLEEALRRLGEPRVELPALPAMHSPVVGEVAAAFRQFHTLDVAADCGVRFYGGDSGGPLALTSAAAAERILGHATAGVQFPRALERAYADGVRTFVEVGPAGSLTRMTRAVLQGRPHRALGLCGKDGDELRSVYLALAQLVALGYAVDLAPLFGPPGEVDGDIGDALAAAAAVCLPMGGAGFPPVPPVPGGRAAAAVRACAVTPAVAACAPAASTAPVPAGAPQAPVCVVAIPARAEASGAFPATAAAAVRTPTAQSAAVAGRAGVVRVAPDGAAHLTAAGPSAAGLGPRDDGAPAGPRQAGWLPLLTAALDVQAATARAHGEHLHYATAALAGTAALLRAVQSGAPVSGGWIGGPDALPLATSGARAAEDGAAQDTAAQDTAAQDTAEGTPAVATEDLADAAHCGDVAAPAPRPLFPQPLNRQRPWLDHDACHELAVGKLGTVLGAAFAAADAFPTRVRLPSGPLLLCHRMMSVDAVPGSMGGGRLVTEHDVHADAWYLDGGRIPTGIAVEAGQADLFLAAYLGIDLHTRGAAVYRLLDAAVTFHDRLPAPGAVLRYEIRIEHFFFQGTTPLFRFSFTATVGGRLCLTMEAGCAGFFTAAELAAGKGLVQTALSSRERPGRVAGGFTPPVALEHGAFADEALDALRRGEYAACFGPSFAALASPPVAPLPGGKLRLIHRVPVLEPHGGRFGLGRIVGEADVRPTDWFLTCHFVDDPVMPGTLMYESCLQTLRVFLMRLGWAASGDVAILWEPKPGVASRLKCRGQVLPSTRRVRYEIELKELGYGPDAYALADATMYADGKPIVEISDMSLVASGLTAEAVRSLWTPAPAAPAFNTEQILAFAAGKPSDCFGEPYRRFDDPARRVARLPRPPYQLLDRAVATAAPAFVMRAGGRVDTEYDVPPDAWYFAAGGGGGMPFALLLEAALQPCGFFSSYMGAALTTDADLYYRNLGGTAVLHETVTPASGTLATHVHCTDVATSAGMIIHKFTFAVSCAGRPVYAGATTFGFFTAAALGQQVGLRQPPPGLVPVARNAQPLPYPDRPYLARAPLLMLDEIAHLALGGGPAGLGFAHGRKHLSPTEWFFAAHFHQDPVMPGSLGLEALNQLLMVLADALWPNAARAGLAAPAPGASHTWTYRGQVSPACRVLDVTVAVTALDAARGLLTADGLVCADGLPIYELRGLTVLAARPAP